MVMVLLMQPIDQMVMIVADPRLVECGGVGGFDAPYQSRIEQGMKVIINGLPGKTTQSLAGKGGNSIGIEMSTAVDRCQHRKARRGNPHPHRPQLMPHFRVF